MNKQTAAIDLNDIPVQEEEFTTNQEAVPMPWVAGTRRLAGRILMEPNQFIAVQAKDKPPAKK